MSTPARTPGAVALSKDAARQLTDQIRSDAQGLWISLLRAFEGDAHGILGYSSWHAYCHEEFQVGQSHSYRLVEAARVIELVEADSPIGERTISSESVAREFTPMLGDPDALKDAHAEAVRTAPLRAVGQQIDDGARHRLGGGDDGQLVIFNYIVGPVAQAHRATHVGM